LIRRTKRRLPTMGSQTEGEAKANLGFLMDGQGGKGHGWPFRRIASERMKKPGGARRPRQVSHDPGVVQPVSQRTMLWQFASDMPSPSTRRQLGIG
jgi:hypothetical protein